MTVIELNPNHLWFEINSEIKEKVEVEISNYTNNDKRAYLNLLCQEIIFPYLQEDYPDAKLAENQAEFWQLGINGTMVVLNNKRLILIPNDAYDIEELRVEQEWVDIPELAADYFLAVQVDIEDNAMRVWGYTTHKQLRETGSYSKRDRTYSLDREELTEEIDALWLINKHFPHEITKAEIEILSELSENKLVQLVNTLGNSQLIFPRRIVDFLEWGQLISKREWRIELIKRRFFDSRISETLAKELTTEELAQTIAKFEQVYHNVEEYDRRSQGTKILKNLMGIKEADLVAIDRSSAVEDKDDLEFELRELAYDLFEKLEEIWSDDESNIDI